MGPPERHRSTSNHRETSPPPRTCKMQEVVTLPFPLTLLWGSDKGTDPNTTTDSNRVVESIESSTNGASADRTAENDTSSPNAVPSSATKDTVVPSFITTPTTKSVSLPTKIFHFVNRKTPQKDIKFEHGTAPMPDEIQAICELVRACKQHKAINMPVRLHLTKNVGEHFSTGAGIIRMNSPPNAWFGDTRLFSKEEWLYLKGKSIDGEV